MASFPGTPPNPLGVKAELNLAGTWTDITRFVMLRNFVSIANMGRADESGSITASTLTLTLKNDGRFTPKNTGGAYYPNIVRNCQIRVSVSATAAVSVLDANPYFTNGSTGWGGFNGTFSVTASPPAGAPYPFAGLFTITTPSAGAALEGSPSPFAVTAGAQYSVSAWVYTPTTSAVIGFDWQNSSHTYLSTSTQAITVPANTWTLVTTTQTAAGSAAFAYARVAPADGAGNLIYVQACVASPAANEYSDFRFWGEISSWPPGYDISQRDTYVDITASGIWRRIQSSSVPIGSCYWRYVNLLTGTSVPAAYWAMEDGSGSANFALAGGTGTNMIPTGTPSYAADGASFLGSNALPTMNGARLAANVSSAATPTNNVFRFALSVPAANDSSFSQFTLNTVATLISSAATIKRVDVTLSSAGQLAINGYTSTAGGSAAFTGTITTKVSGVPVLVSVEITPSGGSINWALKIIKPNTGTVLDSTSGTRSTTTITAVTQVQLNPQGRLQDTTIGQMGVWYVVPALATAASNIGGQAGELAADRIIRLCSESNIPLTIIGSGGAACGPQVSDTMSSVLQSIEATDGGLLYETTGQFGLGYRTLASMQNQSAALTISYTSGALGAPLTPTYDDQLVHNQVTVTNTPTNYSTTAQLNSGAVSIQPPPNGVGQGYATSVSINANANAQADAIATQRLKQGTVDDVRFPTVVLNFQRGPAAPFFSSVPSLRIGDFFQISNLPAFLGGGTAKQLCWGYTETIGGEPAPGWTISINAIPELPFETTFNPGSFTVLQGAAGGVPQGSSVGSTVNGSQVGSGAVGGSQASVALSARSIGGTTQFISAATPYKWSFAVTGTPADNSYFTCTSVQSLNIAVGDTFSNTGGLGSPFTVTSVDQVASGLTNVHFTPDASGVMSSGTVQGGTNGDQWVNTSAGNQVNSWGAGIWNAITWNAHNVITAGTITATEILANTITASQIAAGIVIAGIVDATVITGATIIATGSSGEILAYSGTPALGNLVASVSGSAGSDSFGNAYSTGVEIQTGGLILDNQASAPGAVTNASQLYSSTAGRPRYISQVGTDAVLERSTVNVSQFTIGNTVTATDMSPTMNYAANEGAQSSEFEIEIMGTMVGGPTATVQTFGFRLYIDGSNAGGGFDIGAVLFSSTSTNNQSFGYTVRFLMDILTTGAGGTIHIHSDGEVTAYAATRIQGHDAGLGGDVDGVAFNTTTTHTLKIVGFWGGTATGQTATTYRSKLARRM